MKRLYSVLVENRSGVLSKVSGLFSRRCFNIDSLAVGETDDPNVSCITIVSTGDKRTLEQIEKQLNKKIDVIKIKTFSEEEIVSAVRRQFSWTHIKSFIYIKDSLERQFYMEMCRIEHWDTRTLDEKIDSQLYQRTAISQRPEEVIKRELDELRDADMLNPDIVFRSTYFLDMLGLPDVFSEKDLENSILNQLLEFIKELGSDFTFVDRQKRITVDSEDYFIDLLFFHRGLRRLVAIDLKLGKFKPAYEGQMRLYLRYLNKNDRKPWEEEPIGLILCSEGNTEHIQYFMLDEDSDIRVAQYYTELPSKEVLSDRLQRAIAIAREHHIEEK